MTVKLQSMFTAVVEYDEIDSTNTAALNAIMSGQVKEPTLVFAKLQLGGRGTRGRSWSSPPGNVYASFILPVDFTGSNLPLMIYSLALAVRDTVAEFVSTTPIRVKWPNDVLIGEKKVSGSLHEIGVYEGDRYLVAGIGINVISFPENTLFPATLFRNIRRPRLA